MVSGDEMGRLGDGRLSASTTMAVERNSCTSSGCLKKRNKNSGNSNDNEKTNQNKRRASPLASRPAGPNAASRCRLLAAVLLLIATNLTLDTDKTTSTSRCPLACQAAEVLTAADHLGGQRFGASLAAEMSNSSQWRATGGDTYRDQAIGECRPQVVCAECDGASSPDLVVWLGRRASPADCLSTGCERELFQTTTIRR
jgi:hypothetical protein